MISLEFPYSLGKPASRALLKGENQFFIVHELLDFNPKGEGEHLYLQIETDGDNTQWVAEQLALGFHKNSIDVGFCGRKDRNAITRQWFSIYDPQQTAARELNTVFENLPNNTLLSRTRGSQKLRRGDHSGNKFEITLVLDDLMSDDIELRLQAIKHRGVPNYFGMQRFGRDGNNLAAFDTWRKFEESNQRTPRNGRRQRKPKGIILSAARSYLFNCVLAQRVLSGNWNQLVPGDVAIDGDPSGPLWGRGRSQTSNMALAIEDDALKPLQHWADSLEHLGLQQERRSFISRPDYLSWQFREKLIIVNFNLPPGQYATSILRELAVCYEPNRGTN
jgi:tRNA pseudouridine13 synthase